MSLPYRLADFARDVESGYIPTDPETFWASESAIRRLIAEGSLREWINRELHALRSDPAYAGNWAANEAILHQGNGWTVSIAKFDLPRRFIHVLPFVAFYVPLDAALSGNKYSLPANFRNDVFDPAVRLEPAGPITVPPGEPLKLETSRYAYDFHIPGPLPVLRVATLAIRPLEWLFSKGTLQAWQANDAELSSTQLRVAAYVLGKIAHHSSIAPLRALSTHKHHAVRWAAIQSLGRLSRTEALAKIREAINDPHPHVRRAAQKTLDQLEKRGQR
jgi:hypothetical protein